MTRFDRLAVTFRGSLGGRHRRDQNVRFAGEFANPLEGSSMKLSSSMRQQVNEMFILKLCVIVSRYTTRKVDNGHDAQFDLNLSNSRLMREVQRPHAEVLKREIFVNLGMLAEDIGRRERSILRRSSRALLKSGQ
jgi:hypothetical protein